MVVNATPAPRRRRRSSSPCDLLPDNVYSAYTRVSTREQAESRAGLDSQDGTIDLYAHVHGLEIRERRSDPGKSAKDLARPGMQQALDDVRSGRSRGIIIAKLDRLSRSVRDFDMLMQEAIRGGWNIISVDLGVDLKTSSGRLIAGLMSQISQWEREVIGERTRDGLAEKRKQGVRLGRPRAASDELLETVIRMYLDLRNYSEAARRLNSSGLVPAQGGQLWYPATVRDMVFSQDGKVLVDSLAAVA